MNDSPINATVDVFLDSRSTYQEAEDMIRTTMLRRALHRADGNISRAADLVGMHRNHFTRELEARQMRNLPSLLRANAGRQPSEQLNLWRKRPAKSNRRSRRAA